MSELELTRPEERTSRRTPMGRAGGPRRPGRAGSKERDARWLGGALLAWSLAALLLLGGVHRLAAVTLCGLALLLGGLLLPHVRQGWGGLSSLCLGCSLLSLLSCLPLPCSWLRWLCEPNAEVWTRALSAFEAPPEVRCRLSLAPAASSLEAAKFGAYAVLAAIAAQFARMRGLTPVLFAGLGLGSLVALSALGHEVAQAERLFGFYRPEDIEQPELLALLLNPNNLAGYSNLAVFSGMALLLSHRGGERWPALAVGVALCLAAVLLSASRAGVGASALGLGSLLLLLRRGRRRFLVAPSVAAIVFGGTFAFLASTPGKADQLFGPDLSKLRQVRPLVSAVVDRWPIGVGRGAFESASALILSERQHFTHGQVENFALSWLVEWGAAGGALLLVFIGLARPTRLAARASRRAAILLTGVYCVLAQNLLDLGMEVPALAGAVFTLLGALEGAAWRRRSAQRPARPSPEWLAGLGGALRWMRPAGAVGSFLVLLVSVSLALRDGPALRTERARLLGQAREVVDHPSPAGKEALQVSLVNGMTRWPLEPYFPLIGAQVALAHGGDALPLAGAALRRAPRMGVVHLTVADALIARGRRLQALIHLRHALAADRSLVVGVVRRSVACSRQLARLRQVAPPGDVGAQYLLGVMGALAGDLSWSERWQLLLWAKESAGEVPRLLNAEASLLLEQPGRPRLGRVREIAALLRGSRTCDGLILEARALEAEGQLGQAVERLRECTSCPSPEVCMRVRLGFTDRFGQVGPRRAAEDGYAAVMCQDPESCAAADEFLGSRAAARLDLPAALSRYKKAIDRIPTAERLHRLTELALQAGQHLLARHSLERFQALGGRDDDLAARVLRAERRDLR